MGMCLVPKNRSIEAIGYNWSGWSTLASFVKKHGISIFEFDGLNDGKFICPETCINISVCIRIHSDEYNNIFGGVEKPDGYGMTPAIEHSNFWRDSNGVYQR